MLWFKKYYEIKFSFYDLWLERNHYGCVVKTGKNPVQVTFDFIVELLDLNKDGDKPLVGNPKIISIRRIE